MCRGVRDFEPLHPLPCFHVTHINYTQFLSFEFLLKMAPAAIDTTAPNAAPTPTVSATPQVQTQVTLGEKIIASSYFVATVKGLY
jgi:hypothetical protein